MGDTPRVILFTFAGRRPNMELQAPFVRRILREHEDARWDIWNLARNRADALYLQTISDGKVFNQFYRRISGYADIYKFYADPQFRDCLFVKFDDDVVFIQTDRFADFVAAVDANRDAVCSAKTINNGASTRLEPQLWAQFEQLGIPLLDVHLNRSFAELAHKYFFTHHRAMMKQSVKMVPTQDWLSINCVGYDWATACALAQRIGQPAPRLIAGRKWPPRSKLGDEGAVNMMPRMIVQGFVAAHLAFGPQWPTPEQLSVWRDRYAELGRTYLGEPVAV